MKQSLIAAIFATLFASCTTYHGVEHLDGNKFIMTTEGVFFWNDYIEICEDNGSRVTCTELTEVEAK